MLGTVSDPKRTEAESGAVGLSCHSMGKWNCLHISWFGSGWFWEMRLALNLPIMGEMWELVEIKTG